MPITDEKRCPRCGVVKSRSVDFGNGGGWCRACNSEYARSKYQTNREYREERKAYHRQNERRKRADPVRNEVILARLRHKRATDAQWRAETLSKVKERRLRFVGRDLAIQAKKRSARLGRDFSITPEMVQEMWERDNSCAYCGATLAQATGVLAHTSPSLDRVDPNKGYTPENTVLACFRCNSLKRDATADEIEALAVNFRRVSAAQRS